MNRIAYSFRCEADFAGGLTQSVASCRIDGVNIQAWLFEEAFKLLSKGLDAVGLGCHLCFTFANRSTSDERHRKENEEITVEREIKWGFHNKQVCWLFIDRFMIYC